MTEYRKPPTMRADRRVYGRIRALLPVGKRLPQKALVPARAIQIWLERPDLQATFDLASTAGREGLAWWYLRSGFSELGLTFDPGDDAGLLSVNNPVPSARSLSFLPVTWLMQGLVKRVPVDRKAALTKASEQQKLLDWYFARGLAEANLLGLLTEQQARILIEGSPEYPDTPRLLLCLWSSEPGLRERFAGPRDPAFRTWCSGEGAQEFPILAHPLVALAPPPARRALRLKPFGVNVIGHGHGRSGVSEDARMAVKTLTDAGIPFVLHNISPGPGMPDEEGGISVSELPYAVNLFTMTAAAMVGAVSKIGPGRMGDHYNIGFWPWELPEFPAFWHHAYGLVDEVWASSRFTYDAFVRSSPQPVRHMPFAVMADETDGLARSDFGLPPDRFLFGFAFDGLSSFARKAPLATIRAFQQAFPRHNRSVGLVIKGLRVLGNPEWQGIHEAVDGDDRIHLMTDSLPRGSLLDLWRTLDCFVSLHRSEGFGRNIAETMLLGKPVIVTGHSGNMDFTSDDAAALVPYRLRPVEQGEYPYGAGQLWADPDIKAAADHMRRIVMDTAWRDDLSRVARKTIADRYSPDTVGRCWEPVLREIYERAN